MKTELIQSKLSRWDYIRGHTWVCWPGNVLFLDIIMALCVGSYYLETLGLYAIAGLTFLFALAFGLFPTLSLIFDSWTSEFQIDGDEVTMGFWPTITPDSHRVSQNQSLKSLSEVKILGRCVGLLFRNGQYAFIEENLVSFDLLEYLKERAKENHHAWGFFEHAKHDFELTMERLLNRETKDGDSETRPKDK